MPDSNCCMGERYRKELSVVLANKELRDIFMFISDNNIVTVDDIRQKFSNDNIMCKLDKLKDMYLIREDFVKTEDGIEKVYVRDIILPGYKDIIDKYNI